MIYCFNHLYILDKYAITVGVPDTHIIVNWLIIIARDDEGAARAVASGFKYVIPTPFTFNVPVVKQNVPAPPVWASIKVILILRFNVVGTFVMLIVVRAAFTAAI